MLRSFTGRVKDGRWLNCTCSCTCTCTYTCAYTCTCTRTCTFRLQHISPSSPRERVHARPEHQQDGQWRRQHQLDLEQVDNSCLAFYLPGLPFSQGVSSKCGKDKYSKRKLAYRFNAYRINASNPLLKGRALPQVQGPQAQGPQDNRRRLCYHRQGHNLQLRPQQ